MSSFKVFKELTLPQTLAQNAIYFIGPSDDSTHVEVYVTSNDATPVARHVITKAEVEALITSAVSTSVGAINKLQIAATITDRNALPNTTNANGEHAYLYPMYVYVIDATGDSTVTSGGATYLWAPDATNSDHGYWIKTSEAESLDVSRMVRWSDLVGKPTSTVANIDDAVAKRHLHPNKDVLDQIGQNASGELTLGGVQVKTEWASTAW